MALLVAGLFHPTAPLALRERSTLPPEELPPALERLVRGGGFAEGLILSTCNRTEVYATAGDAASPLRALAFFESLRPSAWPELRAHVYLRQADDAVSHLFRVAS